MRVDAFYKIVFAVLICPSAFAGVVVTENLSPGATSWPGTPFLDTVANPSSDSVEESFNGGSGNTNLSETFTVTTTNYTLSTIDIYAGSGNGTATGGSITLNLYDLGTQTAPNPSPYTTDIIGANLLGGGSGLSINYTSQSAGVLQFAFTGADQVTLVNGHMYAFELSGAINTTPIFWYRGTTDTYPGGAAYRNQAWINGSNARDFSLAVYGTPTTNTSNPGSTQCTVDWNTVYQRIDGFGGSSAWSSSLTMTPAIAGLYFSTNNNVLYTNTIGVVSTNNCVGFSLLRNHIYYANTTSASDLPTTTETTFMQLAQGYGAKVWSTPWTPAAGFKATNDVYDTNYSTSAKINGGRYLGIGNNITNVNYASQLANYVASMKNTYSINLYAISIQNEPDAEVTSYEACQWTNTQIHDFATNLYFALAAKGVGSTKIILPEDENWRTNLLVNAMTDPAVGPDVGIVACHDYGTVPPSETPEPLPTFTNPNAAVWETETAVLTANDDTSITNALYWGGRIYLFMTVAQVNAWHYWWMVPGADNLLDANASPTKRLFAIGQYSRFIRPNYYRIAASPSGALQISAYKDTNSLNYAIVVVNSSTTGVAETFNLTNFQSDSLVTPWMTTTNLSLAPQSPVAITNQSFTYTIPAQSIVTFAGTATNFAPTLMPVQNQTVNAGVVVTVTNVASDVYAPPQVLTFNLLNAPIGASLNSSNGVFIWRPPVSLANTTNLIMAQVVNNGTPALSATNSFDVVINPVAQPSISSQIVSGQNINFVVNGSQGPDYTVLTSTDLMSWQAVITTNSPALPWTYVYTNTGAIPNLFFRIEMGP